MIKKLIIGLLLVPLVMFISFVYMLNHRYDPVDYELEVLDQYLEEVVDSYHFLTKYHVEERRDDITIYIHFNGHEDLEIDQNIYRNLQNFFMDMAVQKQIRDKQMAGYAHGGGPYPTIEISFEDAYGIRSHYFESIHQYDSRSQEINVYQKWTDIEYYVPEENW